MGDDHTHLHHNLYPTMSQQPHPSLAPTQTDLMAHLDRLKFFLATAPSRWSAPDVAPTSHQHPALNRFLLPSGEYVSCVLWSGLYHITGTDIVRALVFRFEAFGRPVRNMKKFEEGVFSDLRNLKPGHDACLEEPKSLFLDLLFKYQCIRTQKKQKVFFWFSVPHDRLFLDALERDLKREKMGLEPTTAVTSEPAASFTYDPKRSLYEQFCAKSAPAEPEVSLTHVAPQAQSEPNSASTSTNDSSVSLPDLDYASAGSSLDSGSALGEPPTPPLQRNPLARTPFFNMFALFEGSPTYKQRRKKAPKARRSPGARDQPLQPQTHPFLTGSGQFGVTASGAAFTSPAHIVPLAQRIRHAPSERSSEPDQERALGQIHDREEAVPDMDMDAEGSPASQYIQTPQYSYEDDRAYSNSSAPVQWAQHAAAGESPAYSTMSAPLPSPGYPVQGYAYDSPTESRSSMDTAPPVAPHSLLTVSVPTPGSYYDAQPQHPLSAPSHRISFDEVYPISGTARRPRSVTPSLPARAPHVRRPSTANETLSTYEAVPSWRTHATRGYHPYAPRAPSTYSSSGSSPTPSTLAVQQEYDASPFAYMVNGAAESYPAEQTQTYEGAAYGPASPESPGVEQPQPAAQYEYAANPEYVASNLPGPSESAPMYNQTVSQNRYYEQQVV